MKAFACAISTLVVLLVLVIANGILFSHVTDSILRNIDKASSPASGRKERILAVNEISRTLEDNSFVLSLSVGHDETSAISAYVSDAKRQISGDEAQYLDSLDKLKTDIMRIRITECFCLDGLF